MSDAAKLLIVPDAFFGDDSGAIAARRAAQLWQDLGCKVSVYAKWDKTSEMVPPKDIRIIDRLPFRGTNHLYGGEEVRAFEQVLDEEHPTHVFFLGVVYSKPVGFFRLCQQRKIHMIGFWWIQDFFCTRGYATLGDGPCLRCIDGNYLHSFIHQCSYTNRVNLVRLAANAVSRMLLKPHFQACDAVLGSTEEQLNLYHRFGVRREKLIQCPLFFDKERVSGHVPTRGHYIVCYGQSRIEKGAHYLKDVISRCPGVEFVFPFVTEASAQEAIVSFGLEELVQQGSIKVVMGMIWRTGVNKIVADSGGILNLSVWPTTTEYTFLEGLGLAKPLFVFDVGIHNEVIRHGENGMMAKLGDVEAVSDHIKQLVSDDELYKRVSAGALALFNTLTDPDAYRSAFQEALDKTH